jgi:hypothetical protein
MFVLVACEFSGVVRDAFIDRGHEAISCDFEPGEGKYKDRHYQGDMFDLVSLGFNLMIAHPPCTYLATSGTRWLYHPEDVHLPICLRRAHPKFPDRHNNLEKALEFVLRIMRTNIPKIAIENPISIISSRIRKPDQIIQPWMFGHGETKATCLWLKGLPKIKPTHIVEGRQQRIHNLAPSPTRWKERSRTYPGIAAAMADQWGIF